MGGNGERRGEFDYMAAFDLIDAGKPSAEGCMGCFRCRAGDHGTCHGCSCPCGWRGAAELRAQFAGVIGPQQCPDDCGIPAWLKAKEIT